MGSLQLIEFNDGTVQGLRHRMQLGMCGIDPIGNSLMRDPQQSTDAAQTIPFQIGLESGHP